MKFISPDMLANIHDHLTEKAAYLVAEGVHVDPVILMLTLKDGGTKPTDWEITGNIDEQSMAAFYTAPDPQDTVRHVILAMLKGEGFEDEYCPDVVVHAFEAITAQTKAVGGEPIAHPVSFHSVMLCLYTEAGANATALPISVNKVGQRALQSIPFDFEESALADWPSSTGATQH